MSYLMNGRMKRWGYSEQIDEFLLNPTQFVRVNEIWKDVQNTQNFTENKEDVNDSDNIIWYPHTLVTDESDKNPFFFSSKKEANFTSRSKEPPRFWQNDGKLTIFGVS